MDAILPHFTVISVLSHPRGCTLRIFFYLTVLLAPGCFRHGNIGSPNRTPSISPPSDRCHQKSSPFIRRESRYPNTCVFSRHSIVDIFLCIINKGLQSRTCMIEGLINLRGDGPIGGVGWGWFNLTPPSGSLP